MRKRNLKPLQSQLGYEFTTQDLLVQALTHRSFGKLNNERLEFLGDSILNHSIAQALFDRFPRAKEGELSRLRAALVKGETLAEIAKEMSLSEYVILGEGELKSGGFRRASILADTVEAIIGAISQDHSFERARECVHQWFAERLAEINLEDTQKDPKTRLQEWLQGRRHHLPVYEVVSVDGESHCQDFTVTCSVDLVEEPTQAVATNRRLAEKAAAKAMLVRLGIEKEHSPEP